MVTIAAKHETVTVILTVLI